VHAFTEALLPEHHANAPAGCAKFSPNPLALNQRRRLLPEQHFAQVAKEQSVADHPVRVRLRRRAKGRLSRARDSWEKRRGFLKTTNTARVLRRAFLNQIPAERGDLDD